MTSVLCLVLFCVCIAYTNSQSCSSHIFAVANAWNGSTILVKIIPSQPPIITDLALAPGIPVGDPVWSSDYDSSTRSIYTLLSDPNSKSMLVAQFQIIDANRVQTITYTLNRQDLFALVSDQHGNLFGCSSTHDNTDNLIGRLVFDQNQVQFIPIVPVLGIISLQGLGVFVSTLDDRLVFTGAITGDSPGPYLNILMTLDLFTREISSVNWGSGKHISGIIRVEDQLVFGYFNGSGMNLASFINPERGTFNNLATTNFTTSSNLAWDSCNKLLWCIVMETHLIAVDLKGVPVWNYQWTTTYFPPAAMFALSFSTTK